MIKTGIKIRMPQGLSAQEILIFEQKLIDNIFIKIICKVYLLMVCGSC